MTKATLYFTEDGVALAVLFTRLSFHRLITIQVDIFEFYVQFFAMHRIRRR